MTTEHLVETTEWTAWRLIVGGFVGWLLYHCACIAVLRCDIEARDRYLSVLEGRPAEDRGLHWHAQVAAYRREVRQQRAQVGDYFGRSGPSRTENPDALWRRCGQLRRARTGQEPDAVARVHHGGDMP